ncbi:MAG: Dolichyl-phosphate-mannose-protein mannosyltransferase, partial [Candidatus Paceibacter sp.]|nr:Dolichyl-phosphate-mannose-protein mannosyltransferase [Candidatus Paceibacter sp.]
VFSPMAAPLSTGYPVIGPVAASIGLFGTGVAQARLAMISYMFLLVCVFYLFAKKRYGFLPALLSTLFLLSFAPFYGNGRPVQGEVPGLFYMMLGAWLMLLWEERNFKTRYLALLSGVSFGLSAATKPIYLFGLGGAFVVALIFWFKKIQPKKNIFIFVGGWILPLLIQIAIQFPTLASLKTIIPTYLHLASNHGSSSVSTFQTIIHNGLKFFTESTPLLFFLMLVTILISYPIITTKFFTKAKRAVSLAEFVIIAFIILNIISYLPGTGWYRYFFPANLLVYVLFPAAFLFIASHIKKPVFKKVALAISVLLLIFQCIHMIFLSDTALTVKRTRNAEFANVLSGVKPSEHVLFYNSPEAIVFLNGTNYSQYLAMEDFLVAGDKNVLENPAYNLIIMSNDPNNPEFSSPCYEKKVVSRYYVFTKLESCEK